MINMPDTAPAERERIMDLRARPRQVTTETYPFRKGSSVIKIDYDLIVPNVDANEFWIAP